MRQALMAHLNRFCVAFNCHPVKLRGWAENASQQTALTFRGEVYSEGAPKVILEVT